MDTAPQQQSLILLHSNLMDTMAQPLTQLLLHSHQHYKKAPILTSEEHTEQPHHSCIRCKTVKQYTTFQNSLTVYHKANHIFSFDLTTSLLVISQMKIKTCVCIKASPWKLTAGLLPLPNLEPGRSFTQTTKQNDITDISKQ